MPIKNLASLAHHDTTASNGKWTSRTLGNRREIFHYGTLMMTLGLDEDGEPNYDSILYQRPGGSMSDKCGLSRIRQSLLGTKS